MKIAVIYSSKTGNTQELVETVCKFFLLQSIKVAIYQAEEFPLHTLSDYDGVIVSTYTWGDGEVPAEMKPVYEAFENQEVKHVTTGVLGTGDSFYPYFCGAVDEFRDMLYVHTNLAVTLKVELSPQESDIERSRKFVELFLAKVMDTTVSKG